MRRWQDLAACKGMPVEVFFPLEHVGRPARGKPKAPELKEEAKRVCEPCQVREQCRDWAIEFRAVGIFGAMDPGQRRAYARKRTRSAAGDVRCEENPQVTPGLTAVSG